MATQLYKGKNSSKRPSGISGSGPSRDKQFLKPNKKIMKQQSTVSYGSEPTKK